MNYFFRGVFQGTRSYWLYTLFLGAWAVAILDQHSSLFSGYWYNLTLYLTILAPIAVLVVSFIRQEKKRKLEAALEKQALSFEQIREKEIRYAVASQPDLVTHCFECGEFDPELRDCGRKLSADPRRQRVREIRIEGRTYCLYWKKA